MAFGLVQPGHSSMIRAEMQRRSWNTTAHWPSSPRTTLRWGGLRKLHYNPSSQIGPGNRASQGASAGYNAFDSIAEPDPYDSHPVGMSQDELDALVHRHEVHTAYLRAQLQRNPVLTPLKGVKMAAPTLRRLSGFFRNKGKGPGPRNWGDISSLNNFGDSELNAQRVPLRNFAEIPRGQKTHKGVTTPRDELVRIELPTRPKAEAKKAKSPSQALKSDGKTPRSDATTKSQLPAHKVELREVQSELPTRSEASARGLKTNRDNKSGQTTNLSDEEKIVVLYQELERQRDETNSPNLVGEVSVESETVTPCHEEAGAGLRRCAFRMFWVNFVRSKIKSPKGMDLSFSRRHQQRTRPPAPGSLVLRLAAVSIPHAWIAPNIAGTRGAPVSRKIDHREWAQRTGRRESEQLEFRGSS
ncbi:hypothetical protein C8R46DRAFT_1247668 [Mycena filopes]|nr:hypothetical protein C8R46DRAFT_1247668 [Mycena filopes]